MERMRVRSTVAELPTMAKLVGGFALSAVAALMASRLEPYLPPGTRATGLIGVSAIGGMWVGWRVIGRARGRGWGAQFGIGTQAALLSLGGILLYLGALQTLRKLLFLRYDGPGEALGGLVLEAAQIGVAVLQLDVLATLFIGGVLGAMLAEAAARRFP